MLRCREISKLVSASMERPLPLVVRLHVRLHLMMCRFCSGFARQLRFLRKAVHEQTQVVRDSADTSQTRLSTKARERIKAAIERELE